MENSVPQLGTPEQDINNSFAAEIRNPNLLLRTPGLISSYPI